jgi:predicted TIM-barrel fold metal-dependent hydrolase
VTHAERQIWVADWPHWTNQGDSSAALAGDEDRIRQAVDRALAQNAEDRLRTGVTIE